MMTRNRSLIIRFTTILFLFIFFLGHATTGRAAEMDQKNIKQVILKVEGMECKSCVKNIRKALLRVPGVILADVQFKEGRAVVEHETGKVTEGQLIKAVESASDAMYTYTASVASRN